MGKIKSKLIKRTAKTLVNNKELGFSDSFEKNKKILGSTMPSKNKQKPAENAEKNRKYLSTIKNKKLEKKIV